MAFDSIAGCAAPNQNPHCREASKMGPPELIMSVRMSIVEERTS
jgi:hypothetical protein